MDGADTGFVPRDSVNPWDEGDYRIYGYAVALPDGGFLPAYSIDRFQGIPDAPRVAVELHEVQVQRFATEGLATMMAVSHGVNRVRSRERLLY